MRKQFKDIDIYAGIKAQDGAKWIKDNNLKILISMQASRLKMVPSGLKTITLRPTGRPQSTLRFVQFIQRKTSKVWSTSTSRLVFLLICVVRTR